MKKQWGEGLVKYVLLISYAIGFYFLVSNLHQFSSYTSYITGILQPVIIGFCMAFVLNILMMLVETKVFGKFFLSIPFLYNRRRVLSLLISLVISVVVMVGALAFIVPQIITSVSGLYDGLPGYINGIKEFLETNLVNLNLESEVLNKIIASSNTLLVNVTTFVAEFVYKAIPSLFDGIKVAASGILTFILSLILAIYMLLDKERLIFNLKRVLGAFAPSGANAYIVHAGSILNKAFHSFISGQITESVILGILCFIGMTIFGFPYAFLISFIIGATCLIPYFGAFIGSVPAFFLILIISPSKAMWFLVFVVVLQQLEGNLIYPKVVGNSVGLPTIWVSIALIVGGNMFGFLGMILGIPIFASAYFLFKEYIGYREEKKGLEAKKEMTLSEYVELTRIKGESCSEKN